MRKVKVQEFALSHFNFAPNGDVVATDNARNETQARFALQFNNIQALSLHPHRFQHLHFLEGCAHIKNWTHNGNVIVIGAAYVLLVSP